MQCIQLDQLQYENLLYYLEKLFHYYLNNYRFFEKYLPGAKKNPHNGLLEKAEIKWFTFAELRKNRGKFRAFYRNMVDVILEHEAEITSKLKRPVCGPKCSFRISRSEGTLRSTGPGRSEGPGRSKHRNLTVKKRQTRRTRRRN